MRKSPRALCATAGASLLLSSATLDRRFGALDTTLREVGTLVETKALLAPRPAAPDTWRKAARHKLAGLDGQIEPVICSARWGGVLTGPRGDQAPRYRCRR